MVVGVFLYLFCVSTSGYGKLFYSDASFKKMALYFAKPYTSVLVGVPYFIIGRILAKHQKKANKSKFKQIFMLIALALCAGVMMEAYLVVEVYRCAISSDCYFLLLPCSVAVLLWLLTYSQTLPYALALRKYSTLIFFSHFLWLWYLKIIEKLAHHTITYSLQFFIALSGSILTAFLILKLENRPRLAWLRFLH